MRRLVLIVVVLACAVALLLLGLGPTRPAVADPAAEGGRSTTAGDQRASRAPRSDLERRPAASASATFVVRHGARPMAGVPVVGHATVGRSVSPAAVEVLGETDRLGALTVPIETLRVRASVTVEAPSMRPVALHGPFAPKTYVVDLVRGSRLIVRLHDTHGDPATGVRLHLSSGAFSDAEPRAGDLPGSAANPIRTAEVGEDGAAEFDGLPLGRYLLRAADGCTVPASHQPAWSVSVDELFEEHEFEVRRLRAGVLRVRGDDLLVAYPRLRPGDVRGGGPGFRMKRELEARYPGAFVTVVAPGVNTVGAVDVDIVGMRTGMRRIPLSLHLCARDVEVHDVDLSDAPSVAETASVEVRCSTPSGVGIRGIRFHLEDRERGLRIPMVSGRRATVRTRSYRVAAAPLTIGGRRLGTHTVEVERDTRIVEVVLAEDLAACRLSVVDRSGDVLHGATVRFGQGRWSEVLHILHPENTAVVLPTGRVETTVSVLGFPQHAGAIQVAPPGAARSPQDFVVVID